MSMDGDIAKVQRPCPFCGCTTIKHRNNGENGWLECDWCQATGPYSSEDAAADLTVEQAWDMRIPEQRVRCVKDGHYWSSSSLFPGTEYCQACGATRARVKVEI